LKNLKVVGTKVTRTSDFVLLEVEKGEDSIELIEKILKNIDSGSNTRFSVRTKDNCEKCFAILLASGRICNNSSVREILKGTGHTLLLP
jgi:polyphosphate kinase